MDPRTEKGRGESVGDVVVVIEKGRVRCTEGMRGLV